MAKRLALIALVTLMALVVVAPAATAAPSQRSIERHVEVAALQQPSQAESHASNAGGNGKSHALENAARGMNRIGSPGTWKEQGHIPSANSAPQGHSPSNPDADGNGGIDKPGQTGGFNADRDGNNGCGNDSDREDDNNGWCGKKPTAGPPGGDGGGGNPPVLGPRRTVVLPSRTTLPGTLPSTGMDVGDFLWGGWSLILAGAAMRRRELNRRHR